MYILKIPNSKKGNVNFHWKKGRIIKLQTIINDINNRNPCKILKKNVKYDRYISPQEEAIKNMDQSF